MKNQFYFGVSNMMGRVRGKKHSVSMAQEHPLMIADDGECSIYFCRLERGNFFKRGIKQRISNLAWDYHLDTFEIVPGGAFIDCGANIGELGIWARDNGLRYVAFEPEALEARCCDINNFSGKSKTHRLALWNKTTTVPFFSKPESADSSILEIEGETHRTMVQATKLDDVLDLSGVSGTIILKIEAEGAEPEVLQGSTQSLSMVDWVTVDCGFERGKKRAHTFVETNLMLHDHGFRLCQANLSRITTLYRNKHR
ncbi:MAG: FkbM family methyltransferase [Gammaproteobacteria bacterium]|nr:FkbM family methyltransferase [Gammaproteobacteria bacterium]MCY4227093.1 FkbM family methyltransferase [Gammaproteobacteria bacterium]